MIECNQEILDKQIEKKMEKFIFIKSHLISFVELQNIVDYSLLVIRKNIDLSIFYSLNGNYKCQLMDLKSYYMYKIIKKNINQIPELTLPTDFSLSKKELLILYLRISNNSLITIFTVFNHYNQVKKIIDQQIELKNNNNYQQYTFEKIENNERNKNNIQLRFNNLSKNHNQDHNNHADNKYQDDPNNDHNDDNNDDNNKDNNDDDNKDNSNKKKIKKIIDKNLIQEFVKNSSFIDIIKKNIISFNQLTIIDKEMHKSLNSNISFWYLSSEDKINIQKILSNFNNPIIVEKKYFDILGIKEFKFSITNSENQFQNEVTSLLKLHSEVHFPTILSFDINNKSILMSYCGEPITDKNIPLNWKDQLNEIVKKLEEKDIYNNDMWKNNFLVLENTLHLIDFGWSTSGHENYPFINITKNDTLSFDNFINLLDQVFQRVIEDRIIYINTHKK